MRRVALFLALGTSLVATFWARSENSDQREPDSATIINSPEPADSSVPILGLARLGRRAPADTDVDLFRAKTWYSPPPPSPPMLPPVPEKKSVPSLPFQYVGKLEEVQGGRLVIYLAKGEDSFAVSPGETFDGTYKFNGIEGGQLSITYLPLSEKQRLPIGVQE